LVNALEKALRKCLLFLVPSLIFCLGRRGDIAALSAIALSGYSKFAINVAIGGKADMTFCTAYVR
jgi:putative Ca2+/H+ antiporter (TMEM165/GDT1 family)